MGQTNTWTVKQRGTIGCISLLLLPIALIWKGWILATLWKWFIVPVFDMPILLISQAIGLATVWSLLSPSSNRDDDKPFALLESSFIKPLILLIIGWIVHFSI